MKVWPFFSVIILALGPLLTHCSASKDSSASEYPYSVDPLTEEGAAKLIQERNGKILLLNVWATWCVPCKEEFPDLVKLADFYQGRDLEIVGLSVDYADEVESKILPFLRKYHANFKVYVKHFGSDEAFINSLGQEWNGGVPATFIFDASGRKRSYILGKRNFDFFKQEIEKIRAQT